MYRAEQVKAMFALAADVLAANVDELARLDGLSGDGDLGASMAAAGAAMRDTAAAEAGADLGALMMKAAMACNKAAPSTMGTLLSSGVMALAKASKGKEALTDEDIVTFPRLFAEAIMARGKSQVGDKTILDALMPMAEAVEADYAANHDLKQAFAAGAQAAQAGAEATCGMVAKVGRAHWIGERAKEHMDGGAALCAMLAKRLAE